MEKLTGASYVIVLGHTAGRRGVELHIVRMATIPKATFRVNATHIKISTMFLAEIEKSTVTFIWNLKRPQIAKSIFKKNKVGELTLPDFFFLRIIYLFGASLVAQIVENPPAMKETWVQPLGQEDSLEKGTATYLSIILAWRIPWTKEPGGLVHGVAKSRTRLSG